MQKARCCILVLVLCMLVVPCSGLASGSPELTICAESYPSEVVEFILSQNSFPVRSTAPGKVSTHSYADFLQSHQNDTNILLVCVSSTECQALFQSGYCSDLSGVQFLREFTDRLPNVIRNFCYLDNSLFAVPVSIRFTEDTTIHTYEELCALSEYDGSFQITIAIVPRYSLNQKYSVVFLHQLLRSLSNNMNMLYPPQ